MTPDAHSRGDKQRHTQWKGDIVSHTQANVHGRNSTRPGGKTRAGANGMELQKEGVGMASAGQCLVFMVGG